VNAMTADPNQKLSHAIELKKRARPAVVEVTKNVRDGWTGWGILTRAEESA